MLKIKSVSEIGDFAHLLMDYLILIFFDINGSVT